MNIGDQWLGSASFRTEDGGIDDLLADARQRGAERTLDGKTGLDARQRVGDAVEQESGGAKGGARGDCDQQVPAVGEIEVQVRIGLLRLGPRNECTHKHSVDRI